MKLQPGVSSFQIAGIKGELGARTLNTFRSQAEHWSLGPGVTVEHAVARLQASGLAEYAEPNYLLGLDIVPNDPRLPELYGMINTGQTGGTPDADIDADLAWGVSTGSANVVVGVIDTGVDYNHPDLAANIWTNPGEVPGNGVDDDANGFVDDIHGYDFINNDADPFDDHGHGTHVSGTIGGIGNNGVGVVGVTWTVRIAGLKFLSSGGSGSTANAVRAVDYAVLMGFDLTSNSWGGGSFSQTLYDAIARANAANQAFVAAAGNSGTNNDTSPHYPSSYDLPNIIAVAATDHNDALASFSCWGPTSVDLAAPGVNTLSTLPGNSYGQLSGTSMATPHVSGACALIRAVNPNIPIGQMKSVLMNSVDHPASLAGKVVSNGRLNAFRAIAEPDTVPPGAIDDLAATNPTSNTMGLAWTATGDDGEVGTATYYEVRYSSAPIDGSNWEFATRAGNEPEPQPVGSPQSMEVRNLAADSVYYFAAKAFDEWGNAGPVSNLASAVTLPPPTGSVDPTFVFDELLTGETADHMVTLSNVGVGTLDYTIPPATISEPMGINEPLELGKDDVDPRTGPPVTLGYGGPDAFGYRWVDSDETGGPVFNWVDISGTGTPLNITGDDATTGPIDLGFNFPFYGTLFNQIRACSNGWISFTNSSTSYSNQPLPNSGAPENLIAPFWDDLNPSGTNRMFFQSFEDGAIVQWQAIPKYNVAGTAFTFQVILETNGGIIFQYLTMTGSGGDGSSATVGIQNAAKTIGLQPAFNQAYVHDGLAVRISSIPQWLTASPTSGRLYGGQSQAINLHMNAAGLEGGTYPATLNIETNDPANPILPVTVNLHVVGAPDAFVQPLDLPYGTVFLGQPYTQDLIVRNNGTDTLHVSSIASSSPEVVPVPSTFNVPPHGSQTVVVTWTSANLGPFAATLTVNSDDAAEPAIPVSVSGNAVPSPVMLYSPTSFSETLYSGNQVTRPLVVTNTGGPDLVVDAAADLGGGQLVYADDVAPDGAGGPDAFGYRWKDSDASGGPTYAFEDISATGTQIFGGSVDDSLSPAITMGMTFPFYGNNFSSMKVSSNGWLTFTTTETASRNANSALPGTGGAANMLAVFWDDLHTRTNGRVYYKNTGSKFIVQWNNVQTYSPTSGNTSSLTFQVQLFPNGKILYMYNTMTPSGTNTFNSATIGIQNQAKTIGLTANYNAVYVHNSMAIQFSRTPDWLSVSPSHAQIPPGQSFTFNVTFDSTERQGGVLSGAIVLNTNVPSQAQERVPATLTVIGVPIASIVPGSYAYGTRYTGYPYLTTFQVVNNGTDVLNVANVYSDDPTLEVSEPLGQGGQEIPEASFPLAPGAARLFELRWVPTVPGALAANVHVISDDPVNPDKLMPVTGAAILPPVAAWAPPSFSETANAGEILHRTLHLENNGGSDLTFVSQVGLLSGATVTVDSSPELKKDEEDTREGVLGTGGPDLYGYTWRDSDQAGGPVFAWDDISSIGTPITFGSNDDSNFGPISLGFPFPFYGNSFSSVRVTTNGWLSFTNTGTALTNYLLPSTSAPENLLSVFHDDLYWRTTQNATCKYYSDGNKFIVQWNNWDQLTPSGQNYNFQVILYRNGRIVYQYLSMTTADLNGATVGIQNATKDDGLTVAFNQAYIHDNLAVEFRPPAGWLQLNPEAGTLPPGGSVDIDVTFDSTGLIGGMYNANIDLSTNDPANASIRVPAAFRVIGIPDIAATPTSLTYPMTYVGYNRTLAVNVKNVGTDVLTLTGASITGDFSFDGPATPVALAVGSSATFNVTFAPATAGSHGGELTFASDDPDEPSLVVPLAGDALLPPELAVDPNSLWAAVPPNSTTTRLVQVCNTGGSDLNWSSGMNIISGDPVVQYEGGPEMGKDEPDTNPGILGTGGPDAFGYKWVDSDEPGGPIFDWVDITSTGTRITALDADDEVIHGIPLGMDFKYYGNTFNTLSISTNGWLSFSYTGSTSYLSNYALPSSSGVPDMLALFWDDLDFRSASGSGAAYYWSDGNRFVLSYVTVPRYSTHEAYTFQVILSRNGGIKFQYLSMEPGRLDEATIGIQNQAKNDGLTVAYNADYVHDGMAVEFRSIPEWATIVPDSGVVPAGACQDVVVTFDSTDMEHGLHQSVLRFQAQNDPYLAAEDVDITMAVNVKPVADAGTPQTGECANLSATFTLNGTGSSDADGDPLTYLWSAPGITFDDPTSATPTASFPLGSTTVTLVVNDGYEDSDPATVVVTVVDTVPPTISVATAPEYLWPPNHKMSTVNATVVVTDVCDPTPTFVLSSAASDEPDDATGGGDGHTTEDIQEAAVGTPDVQVLLRAEREGKGDGRVYTLGYTASDRSGNTAGATAAVDVPHSLGDVVEPLDLVLAGRDTTSINWGVVNGALHYDVIRGDLANLRIQGSNVNLGAVSCVDRGSLDTTASDTAVPQPGQVFFYAVQFNDGFEDSSYGSESVGRARVVGSGDCP